MAIALDACHKAEPANQPQTTKVWSFGERKGEEKQREMRKSGGDEAEG